MENNHKKSEELTNPYEGNHVVRSSYPDIEIPEKTFVQLILEGRDKWNDRTAVVCGESGDSYTYGQLLDKSVRIGQALVVEGLKQGDVVAFVLNNSPEYLAALIGTSGFGFVINSINTLFKTDEIASQLKNSKVKCVLTSEEKAPIVMEAVSKLNKSSGPIVRVLGGRQCPSDNCDVPVLAEQEIAGGYIPPDFGRVGWTGALAVLSYSSGTTGLPKAVCLSHRNITASLLQMGFKPTTIFRETTDNIQENLLVVIPIFHNYGLIISLAGLCHGSRIVTLPKFNAISFLTMFTKYQVSMLFAVPPIIQFIGQREEVSEELKYLRCIMYGGAPIGEKEIQKMVAKLPPGVTVTHAYGQTESTCYLAHVHPGVEKLSSIGQVAVNTELMIVDPVTGRPLGASQVGEIYYRGPQTFFGYLNDAKSTSETLDKNGWCHSGDLGYFDDDLYFYIVDRVKELIKVKGFQVAPAELEAVLMTHPKVADAAVTGIPHIKNGEAPVGFVKAKVGEDLTEHELKDFLSTRVASYKNIDTFYFVQAIPRSPAGKILRRELKNMCKNM